MQLSLGTLMDKIKAGLEAQRQGAGTERGNECRYSMVTVLPNTWVAHADSLLYLGQRMANRS